MSIFYTNKDSTRSNQDHIEQTEVQTSLVRHSKTRREGRFLKGPIPMPEIAAAACLPGKALALFLAVHHQVALTGRPSVTLPARLLAELGVSRDAKARGLKHLEHAGLVTLVRARGRAARIYLGKPTQEENNVV